MKLVLANNQSDRFTAFYAQLRAQSNDLFDYAGYESLLFSFGATGDAPLQVYCTATGKQLTEYDGVYLAGYAATYELAAAMAICCDARGIPFIDRELADPPSLSKITAYAKLAAANVCIPRTFAGCKTALLAAQQQLAALEYPIVLKRADADRGIDNFKVSNADELASLLAPQPARSMWIVQDYVPNNGFYRIGVYGGRAKYGIFRSLQARPDGNARKAHLFKPAGGSNATLHELESIPPAVVRMAEQAATAMNRQIAGVDCIYSESTDQVYILEVNYNPQLVTVSTFQESRSEAFLEAISSVK